VIKDKRIALAFRAVALVLATSGFLSMLGVFEGTVHLSILAYYTMLSNVLVIVLFCVLTVRTARDLRKGKSGNAGYYARFEMVCAVDILLTFVVYWVLLAPTFFAMDDSYEMWTFGNLAVHCFTPLLCILDYFLFTQARHLKYRDVYYSVIFPVIYLVATSAAGLLGYVYSISQDDGKPVRFPYFFFDFDRLGIWSFVFIGAILIYILLNAHVFYLIDKKIRKNNKNRI